MRWVELVWGSAFLAVAVACAFGCASFRGYRLGAVPPFSQVQVPAPLSSITLVVASKGTVNGKEKDIPEKLIERWATPTLRAYKESRYFSGVEKGLSPSDVRAEITITDAGEGSQAGAFFAGLTLLVIPAAGTDVMTTQTSFKDRDGNDLGTIEKTEAMNSWIGLLLIFAMPFAWPGSVLDEIVYDLNRATLVEAAERGWLTVRPVEPAVSP